MKKLLFAFMLLAFLQSNAQQIIHTPYVDPATLTTVPTQTIPSINPYCAIRGHYWITQNFLTITSDYIATVYSRSPYIRDTPDSSWLVTITRQAPKWCARCKKDTVFLDETKLLIWVKGKH